MNNIRISSRGVPPPLDPIDLRRMPPHHLEVHPEALQRGACVFSSLLFISVIIIFEYEYRLYTTVYSHTIL